MRDTRDEAMLQFRVLYRVFLLRVVDLESLAAEGDTTRLLGQFAALLAAISLLFILPLIVGAQGWPNEALWIMEHFLIATTMLAVGLFTLLHWDSTFPDKRDLMVLGPLPVAPHTIFLAKFSALAYALGLSVIALNVFTGILWALEFSPATTVLSVVRSVTAYWFTMFVAGLFMFCCVLGTQGIASHILPRQLYLRTSAVLQTAGFCILLGTYILEPSLELPEAMNAAQNHTLLAALPSYWFYGLYRQMNGSIPPAGPPVGASHAALTWLATRAWTGCAVAIFAATATLLPGYFRVLRKIVEAPDILPSAWHIRWPQFHGGAKQSTQSTQGAILRFCVRAVLRSRTHRVLLSFYLGVAFACVAAYVSVLLTVQQASFRATITEVNTPFLAASILFLCASVLGVRTVASMPVALPANWVFRITELCTPQRYCAAVRRAFLLLGVAPVWSGVAIFLLCFWPWFAALKHLIVLGLVGLIFVELSLIGFRKIPFTCSYLPGNGNIQYVFWIGLLILGPVLNAAAAIEKRTFDWPLAYGLLLALLIAFAVGARLRTASVLRSAGEMQFEESIPPEICALKLDRS